jgi:hypothetical protein
MPGKLSKRQTAGVSRALKGVKTELDTLESKINKLYKLEAAKEKPRWEAVMKGKSTGDLRASFKRFLKSRGVTKKPEDFDIFERIKWMNAWKEHVAKHGLR